MDRLLTCLFLLLLFGVGIFWVPGEIQRTILTGALAAVLFCGIAFLFKILTFRGAAAASVLGAITYGLGGWPIVTALLSFFVSSALISQNRSESNHKIVRRNGRQVWANGFWLAAWLIFGVLTGHPAYRLAAFAAIATATADTWATELGSERFNVKTYLISTGKKVRPGRQGGVSGPGLTASFAGSGFIALIYYLGGWVPAAWWLGIWAAGMAGSLIDSYLGATLQGQSFSLLSGRSAFTFKVTIDNNLVNWLATGLSSILILILNMITL